MSKVLTTPKFQTQFIVHTSFFLYSEFQKCCLQHWTIASSVDEGDDCLVHFMTNHTSKYAHNREILKHLRIFYAPHVIHVHLYFGTEDSLHIATQ